MGLDDLAESPVSQSEREAWMLWAQDVLVSKRPVDVLTVTDETRFDPPLKTLNAWRAVLLAWAKCKAFHPDNHVNATHAFMKGARQCPVFVSHAARLLLQTLMRRGSTSMETLYLAGAFAWGLGDVHPRFSRESWEYLVHAPWQTDSQSLIDFVECVENFDGRSCADLARERLEQGNEQCGRELLEAIATIQSGVDHILYLVNSSKFYNKEKVRGAFSALVCLAELYKEKKEDQVHAREVMNWVAQHDQTATPIRTAVATYVRQTVWDRPIEEAYLWAKHITDARQLEAEIKSAKDAGQLHHARRLGEAVIVHHFDRPYFNYAAQNITSAIRNFCKKNNDRFNGDVLLGAASTHLAVLYSRCNYPTQYARDFVHAVLKMMDFTGKGAPLYDGREELEEFYNYMSPYNIFVKQQDQLSSITSALRDDECRASDKIHQWFSSRFKPTSDGRLNDVFQAMTSPLVDFSSAVSKLSGFDEACTAAFRLMYYKISVLVGGQARLRKQGREVYHRSGSGLDMMKLAREATFVDKSLATAGVATLGLLPPQFAPLILSGELGITMMCAFQAVARVAAVYDRPLSGASGFQFVADAFSLGVSSTDGVGLMAYLTGKNQRVVNSLTLGNIQYKAVDQAKALWTTPGLQGTRLIEQLLRHLGRICGLELSQNWAAKLLPVAGAVFTGSAAWKFISEVTEAAIHIAAREALMQEAYGEPVI